MKLFSKGLEQEIEGGSRDHPLFSQWYDRATKFSDLIVASYPSLKFPMNLTQADRHGTPRRRNDLAGASSPIRQTVEITISDDEEKAAAQPANKKRKINTIPRPFFQSREPPVPRSQEATPLITGWEIDKLRDLTRSLNKGLPGARDIEVTSTIFKDSISHWRELLLGFLREVKDQIGNMIDEHVAKVFSQWDNTEMYELISRIVSVFCQSVFEKQLAVSEDYLRMEIATVLTFDFQAKERYERDDKAYLHEKSREWVFKGEVRRKQLWSPDQPISLAVQNQIKDEVEKSPPPFESEIDEMTVSLSLACARTKLTIFHRPLAHTTTSQPAALLTILGSLPAPASSRRSRRACALGLQKKLVWTKMMPTLDAGTCSNRIARLSSSVKL